MEITGAHGMTAMPSSDGQRKRHRQEGNWIFVDKVYRPWIPLRLDVDLSESIAGVKVMIYEKEGTHPMQQVLKFRGQVLDKDYRTLADYGILNGSYLLLIIRARDPPEMESTEAHRMEGAMPPDGLRRRHARRNTIFIRTRHGETLTLVSDHLSVTLGKIRAIIYEKEGTHPSEQVLIFDGRRMEKDYCTLEDYGFKNGSLIDLVPPLTGGGSGPRPTTNIFVKKLDGEKITLGVVSLRSPIFEVRALIRNQQGIRQTQQHLLFCGRPLDDDRTLEDYNVQENSTLHLAAGPRGGGSSSESKDNEELVKTGLAAAVDEGSSQRHEQLSSGSQAMVVGHEGSSGQVGASGVTEEPASMVVSGTDTPDGQLKQQMKRSSKYSLKALLFAITMFATYYYQGSASTLSPTGSMVFKIAIGAFFIADAALSINMPAKWGSGLVYLSWFLLVLVSYLLIVSFNKYYGYAILPVPLPIIAALLQHKLRPRLMQQRRTNNDCDQNSVDVEGAGGQDQNTDEEDGEHFDHTFELSGDIVNCGGLITAVFGNSMVGPVSAVGFLFFYTVALGLYLMMVTTVRTVVLTAHARYLAILLKVLIAITLIAALIHGVRRSNDSSV